MQSSKMPGLKTGSKKCLRFGYLPGALWPQAQVTTYVAGSVNQHTACELSAEDL